MGNYCARAFHKKRKTKNKNRKHTKTMNQHIPSTRMSARVALKLGLAAVFTAALAASAQEYTKVKPYAVAVSPDYVIQPLLTVGDQVPNTSDPTKTYQPVGIPDGLGVTKGKGNTTLLYMNHELVNTVLSEPNVGGPTNRGAFVSRWTLDKYGRVLSGERAYNKVYDEENGLVYPAAEVGNTTPGFGRFCSGSLAYKEAGFDRPINLRMKKAPASTRKARWSGRCSITKSTASWTMDGSLGRMPSSAPMRVNGP